QGAPLEKDAVKKWYERACKQGEEAYLVAHVFPNESQENAPEEFPKEHILNLIIAKYPKRLPQLYRTVLEKYPRMQAFEIAEAIRDSKLPKEEKIGLFLHAIGRPNPQHRFVAICQLKDLDKPRYLKLVRETLNDMPKDVEGEYWLCPEAKYASLAAN